MHLRVKIFNTSSNLPLFAAVANGYFAARGLEIEVSHTPNSDVLRQGLVNGDFDIAHAAVDNAVALIDAGHPVVIVCGGDAGMNDFMVRPEIAAMADIRGKRLAVDAPNTAYALAAKMILRDHGLAEGRDYEVGLAGGTGPRAKAMAENPQLAAGLLNPPFSVMVREQGLRSLGTQFSFLGPYQATGAFTLRAWANGNEEVLRAYLAAYIRGQRFVMAPDNRAAVIELLQRQFTLRPEIAAGTYDAMLVPGSGFAEDARFSQAGFDNVLRIRAAMEGTAPTASAAPAYYDGTCYERALATLGAA